MSPEPEQTSMSEVAEASPEASIAEPGSEFIVRVNKTDQKLGMKLDIAVPSHTFVASISDGLITEWNKLTPELAVLPDDQLVKINGEEGEGKAFEDKLKSASGTLELTFKRPVHSTFTLNKDGQPLGLSLRLVSGTMALGIAAIKDEGAWKACEGIEDVQVNDRVVMVNGVRDTSENMLEVIKTQEALDLSVCCYAMSASEELILTFRV
jgi:hypothetical protein